MTRAMAVDLGPRIRVNAIEPSAIETEMLKSGFSENYELYTELMGYHPRMRIGDPAEVAALAIALSGDGMNFLSGCSIGLDGGIASRLHDPS
jgi:NAD(P)-dependent dehydrogenase (short-subunit alcohol dehydrogenase family)